MVGFRGLKTASAAGAQKEAIDILAGAKNVAEPESRVALEATSKFLSHQYRDPQP